MMNLINPTEDALSFIREWNDANDFIVAHTSGSTGVPKQIRLLKKDMLASANATVGFFDIRRNDTLLCPLSANYIAGKMMIVRAMAAGCRLIMEQPSNTPLKRNYGRIRLLPVVPSQLSGLNQDLVSTVDNLLIGGAPLSPLQETEISRWDTAVYASYGMTETASHVALRRVGTEDCFTALEGITFSTDPDSCLKISAPAFSFGTLQTNDVVHLLSEKKFIWIGRRDNVVNSGGIKLHPEAIEKKIAGVVSSPFYLVGEPDPKWGQRLVMYVESDVSHTVEARLREILPHYEIPKEIRFVPQFKRTASGKIIRELLGQNSYE